MRRRIKLAIISIFVAVQVNAQDFTNTGISNLPPVNRSCQAFVDVNWDGLLDIFISGKENTTARTDIYLNNGDTSFSQLPASFAPLYSASASWADYNNDTWPDLLISGTNTSLQKICKVYKNNGDSTFTDIATGIDSIAYGSALWADFNNDCKQDIFICGINASGQKVSHIYKNTGAGFELCNTAMPGVSASTAAIIDYNNDGKPDILYSGLTASGTKSTYLYRNLGNFAFQSITLALEKIDNGDMAVGDYDSDGDPDILLTGFNASGDRVTKLYSNNGGIFMEVTTAAFEALGSGSAAFGEMDNDGLTDIILTGMDDASNYQTLVYRNNGNHTFTDIGAVLQGVTMGLAIPGDFNNDGDLDILISGTSDGGTLCRLYNNETALANTTPLPPSVLSSLSSHDSVRLTWDAGSDAETPAGGLTYNIYIGTQPGKQDILSALSDNDGFRAIPGTGQQQQAKSVSLYGLPQGKYYWSVQSIDNGYVGSAFAPADSFTICHHIFIGNDTSVCRYDTLKLSLSAPSDSVNWYSLKNGLLKADSYFLDFVVSETDTLMAELHNSLGCIMYDTLVVEALSLPDITLGNDTAACQYSAFSLSAGSGWKEVTWFIDDSLVSSEDTLSFIACQPVAISVIVSNGPGCISYDTMELSILSLPDINLGKDTSLCYSDSITLMTGGNYPLSNWWIDGEVSCMYDTFTYISLASKTIICEAAFGNGCTNRDTLCIETLSLPVFSLGNDTSLCFKDSLILKPGSGWLQAEWFLNDNPYIIADSIIHCVERTHTLGVLVTDNYYCTNRDTIVLTKLDLPAFSLGNDTAICDRSLMFLSTGTGWENVDWYSSNEGLLETATWFYNHAVTSPDTLWAEVTSPENCINLDTIVINMLSLPQFFIGNDTSLCYGEIVVFSAGNSWLNINWHSQNSDLLEVHDSIISIDAVNNDVIWAEVINNNQCANSDTAQIQVLDIPAFDLGNDTLLCYEQVIRLSVPDSLESISWTLLQENITIQDSSSISFPVARRDTIIAEAYNDAGCINYDTLIVDSISLPQFTLAADTSVCRSDTLVLSAGNHWASVDWYDASGQLLLKDTTGLPLKYYGEEDAGIRVVITDITGCISSDSIAISVLDLPPVFAGNDTLICYHTSVHLGAELYTVYHSASWAYSWHPAIGLDNPDAMNPLASPDDHVVYTIEVRDEYGCMNRDSISVTVNPVNTFNYSADLRVCLGEDINIGNDVIVTGSLLPYTYQWHPEESLSLTDVPNPVASPVQDVTYELVVFTGSCKPDTIQVNVDVLLLPVITTSGDITIGSRENAQLLAGGGLTYQWSPRNSLNYYDVPDPVAYPEFTTVYTAVVTDSLGCSNDTTITVTVRNGIFIPNLFTPNGDGMNDNFLIYGFGIEFLELEIYNRLGQKVYVTESLTEATQAGWDGTFNGSPLESGKYVWYIKGRYADGKELLFEGKNNGIITLVR